MIFSPAFEFEGGFFFAEEHDLAAMTPCTPVQRRVSDFVVTQSIGPFGNSTCRGGTIIRPNMLAEGFRARRDSARVGHPRVRSTN
ncbi:MAG: hypothetical protein ABI587_17210 [Gemmatimonadales bacterium]